MTSLTKEVAVEPVVIVPSYKAFKKADRSKVNKILRNGVPFDTIKFAICPDNMYPGTCSKER